MALRFFPLPASYFQREFDVVILTDIRFPGGSGSSTVQEIRVQHRAGLRTGLIHAPSTLKGFPKKDRISWRRRRPSEKVRACLAEGMATLLNSNAKIYAPLTIIRHPTVASSEKFLPKQLDTDEIVVVINHPAIRGHGKIDYELSDVVKTVKSVFGIHPKLCPISPVIAEACCGPESRGIQLDGLWSNIFDIPPEVERVRTAGAPIVIGRHSRDNQDKWPTDPRIIRDAYPLADGISVKVLGGASVAKDVLGKLPPNWEILPFDPFGAQDFLRSIDVYVYFHHPDWIEAFGRAPCEAMLAGLPTILPPAFEPTFGEAALYCEPGDVLSSIRKLQNDPQWYAHVSMKAREITAQRFGPSHHFQRLMRIDKIAARLRGTSGDQRRWRIVGETIRIRGQFRNSP